MKKYFYLFLAILATAALHSCKNASVTGVELNKTKLALQVGETETLTATVIPQDADDKTVSWASGNTAVADVDNNGKVTAKAIGTAMLTVTSTDGGKTASCAVTVMPCNCIMDSLRGEWKWFKKEGGWRGRITDNDFNSTVKVMSQNEDGAINCEVIVDDTLFYAGSFQLKHTPYYANRRTADIKLPHNIIYSGGQAILWHNDWMLSFEDDFMEQPDDEILCFWDGVIDGYFYYYKKIK
ncbi:Ig-like domain-containing protein [Bacteroidales bacterium OttesenSCG-928-B11]|nr:Ig-like domain-containing protein [Bacteroidales bacterium OttesenSCG-928-E04]MDL2313199.1 Ig-like domain-containing protein [Bacteroidales bacterium OttesenSCG-928-B11]MDL2326909.1 Ig-like domain-containing protein [Bacteroidales bacterium OttesenSCG-928-A14]